MLPRLVVLYSTGMYQILGELNAELVAAAPRQLGPLDFGGYQSMVVFDRKTPTYLLYREVESPVTLESGEAHA